MSTKDDEAPLRGQDAAARKPGTAWPLDVMLSAASAVVERELPAARVAAELKIPHTTVALWVKKYRAGGPAALEKAPGRGGKRTSGYPQSARGRLSRTARSAVDNRDARVKLDPRHEAVLAVKRAEPQAGSRRIRDVLRRFFGLGTSETLVGGLNSYSYVELSPLDRIDPEGLFSPAWCANPVNAAACAAAGIGMMAGAGTALVTNVATQLLQTQCVDWGQAAAATLVGGALGAITGGLGGLAGGAASTVPSSILFGQRSVAPTFAGGPYAGQSVAQVAQALRSGAISPNSLPVNYVVVNGQAVALNNRSLLALQRAGMQPTVANNVTNSPAAQAALKNHLAGGQPSNVVRVRGGPPGTSRIH